MYNIIGKQNNKKVSFQDPSYLCNAFEGFLDEDDSNERSKGLLCEPSDKMLWVLANYIFTDIQGIFHKKVQFYKICTILESLEFQSSLLQLRYIFLDVKTKNESLHPELPLQALLFCVNRLVIQKGARRLQGFKLETFIALFLFIFIHYSLFIHSCTFFSFNFYNCIIYPYISFLNLQK